MAGFLGCCYDEVKTGRFLPIHREFEWTEKRSTDADHECGSAVTAIQRTIVVSLAAAVSLRRFQSAARQS